MHLVTIYMAYIKIPSNLSKALLPSGQKTPVLRRLPYFYLPDLLDRDFSSLHTKAYNSYFHDKQSQIVQKA